MGNPPNGYVPPALGTAQRSFLDLRQPGEVTDVELAQDADTVTTSYSLAPRGSSSGLRSIKVTDPETRDVYYLDYRSGQGAEAGTRYAAGGGGLGPGLTVVKVGENKNSTLQQHVVADHTVDYVVPGDTFTTPDGNVSATVTAMDSTSLDVTVTVSSDLPGYVAPPLPVISGQPEVDTTATVSFGAWPVGAQHDVTWFADGQPALVPSTGLPFHGESFALTDWYEGKSLVARVQTQDAGHRPIVQETPLFGPVRSRVKIGPLEALRTVRVGWTISAGFVNTTPGSTKVTYQWLANGVAIPGATGRKFTTRAADLGRRLSVAVSATKSGFYPASAVSSQSDPVLLGLLRSTNPKVTGKLTVGSTLGVRLSPWSPSGVVFSYQWLRDGKAIKRATKPTYKLKRSAKGHRFKVRVTGSLVGYESLQAVSRSTPVVRMPAHRVTGRSGAHLEASWSSSER